MQYDQTIHMHKKEETISCAQPEYDVHLFISWGTSLAMKGCWIKLRNFLSNGWLLKELGNFLGKVIVTNVACLMVDYQ